MAGRLPKTTVDYFPHDTNAANGKTLFILQSRFGNNGYAGWFKILELLGRTPGHAFPYSKPADWQFLVAYLAFPDREIDQFLNCLAELHAIDPDLYLVKILWSDNLITRISGAYAERKNQIPIKPPINTISPPINTSSAQFPDRELHELKERKLKEIRGKETEPPTPSPPTGAFSAAAAVRDNHLKATPTELSPDLAKLCSLYEQNIPGLTPIIGEELNLMLQEYGLLMCSEAIKQAAIQGKRWFGYVKSICRKCKASGTMPGDDNHKGGKLNATSEKPIPELPGEREARKEKARLAAIASFKPGQ